MDQFLTKREDNAWKTIPAPKPSTSKSKLIGTSTKEQGFNFCNKSLCKYCKILNKTGDITCHTTRMVYPSMHNISCRSSNVIYYMQNLWQTICWPNSKVDQRYKERIYEHLRDLYQANKEKSLGLHCSSTKYEKRDIEVHVLECITSKTFLDRYGILCCVLYFWSCKLEL